MYTCI